MPKVLGARLASGHDLDDDEFDDVYPDWGRRMSRVHWTPVAIARRAAQWLASRPGTRVLDVGSGVGKFAIVGALVTDGVFYGIEQRRHLVDAAQAAARGVGARRAHFLHGNMTSLDWGMFDAFYLYNPFLEDVRMLGADTGAPDAAPDVAIDSFASYIEFVRSRLVAAPTGTRVATYHGFGGDLPPCYQRVAQMPARFRDLDLWVKGRADNAS